MHHGRAGQSRAGQGIGQGTGKGTGQGTRQGRAVHHDRAEGRALPHSRAGQGRAGQGSAVLHGRAGCCWHLCVPCWAVILPSLHSHTQSIIAGNMSSVASTTLFPVTRLQII